MGRIVHHALVVTFLDSDKKIAPAVRRIHKEARRRSHCVTPIVKGINYRHSFAVLPDGSKEGWDASNESDELREWLIAQLDAASDWGIEYCEVLFGIESSGAHVLRARPSEDS